MPRRALRGHAPAGPDQRHPPAHQRVSVPRRALRGHAPNSRVAAIRAPPVSVPRRALRGHAPPRFLPQECQPYCFSAPKGVERACPLRRVAEADGGDHVSVPRRALRGHAPSKSIGGRLYSSTVSVPRRALRGHAPITSFLFTAGIGSFSAPKGVERACPTDAQPGDGRLRRFQCPEGR